MADQAELKQYILFALNRLPAENAHHKFELMCKDLTRGNIMNNIIPATGPVARLGDQGRDFISYKSYLDENLDENSCFIGQTSSGDIVVFTCSIQQNVTIKIKSDVEKIIDYSLPVDAVYFFSREDVKVAKRNELKKWAYDTYNINLEIIDGNAIADLLATPKNHWIVKQYLKIPESLFSSEKRFSLQLLFDNQMDVINIEKVIKRKYLNEEISRKVKNVKEVLIHIKILKTVNDKLSSNNKKLTDEIKERMNLLSIGKCSITDKDWDDYNESITIYEQKLRDYYIYRNNFIDKINKIIELNLILVNNGAIMAEEIIFFVTIPESFKFIKTIPYRPLIPPPPVQKPRIGRLSAIQAIFKPEIFKTEIKNYIDKIKKYQVYDLPSIDTFFSSISELYTKVENKNEHEIIIRQNQLMQEHLIKFEPIHIKIPTIEENLNLKLKFKALVGKPSISFEGNLIVNISFK